MSRINILKKVVLFALAIIAVRLFFIQIIEHDTWVAKASDQHTLLETIEPKRGEIYMMDGDQPVAVVLNQTVYSVIIDPAITEKDKIKAALETHAKEYITADLDQIYNIEGLRYYIVAKNVPYTNAVAIAGEEIAAVWLKEGNSRVYPEGEMASGMLGFVNADGLGQYGVEGSLYNLLSGTEGLLKTVADVNKVALSIGTDNVKIPAEDGKDIVLTVDRNFEKGIEARAQNAINSTNATKAAVLVMNPNTSEVVAMASLPNYDPANYGHVVDASSYINQVTEVPYEPASICKSFTYSAAINEGKMNGDTTFYNNHYEWIDGWQIWNAETRSKLHGEISMRDALYWSLNTGSIHALKLLGDNTEEITQTAREKLYDYYHNKFRLGQATGIELIEAEGYIEDPNYGWGRNSTYANMTFGQNLGITMIQTATAFSAVVNGGYWRTPTIVKGVLESDGTISPLANRETVSEQILSTETSNIMRDLLVNNRSWKVRNGTDYAGYTVGGKTGTAQVIVDGSYDSDMNNLVGSYMGFVGTEGEMPSYVVMIKMWGEGQAIGSGDAMDLFDNISHYIIDYFKIKPKA